jgi:hypothetical protein
MESHISLFQASSFAPSVIQYTVQGYSAYQRCHTPQRICVSCMTDAFVTSVGAATLTSGRSVNIGSEQSLTHAANTLVACQSAAAIV